MRKNTLSLNTDLPEDNSHKKTNVELKLLDTTYNKNKTSITISPLNKLSTINLNESFKINEDNSGLITSKDLECNIVNSSTTSKERNIISNKPLLQYPNNAISTSKYNLLTFLPINMLEQFSKLANIYFLVKFIHALATQLDYEFLR